MYTIYVHIKSLQYRGICAKIQQTLPVLHSVCTNHLKCLDICNLVDITMYTPEGLVEKVYDCIRNNRPLSSIHIPHSDVFFVREALEARFKCELSLSQAEEYMREAGWKDSGDN